MFRRRTGRNMRNKHGETSVSLALFCRPIPQMYSSAGGQSAKLTVVFI